MEISTVVIETKGWHRPSTLEERLAEAEAVRREIPVRYATEKQLSRDEFRLEEGMMAVGGVPFIKHALRQLGKQLPAPTPYPSALSPLLYRDVKQLRSLRDAHFLLEVQRLFVKPVTWKRFTGFVANSPFDPRFNGASLSAPVWVSTPVNFVSEWRYYVVNGQILYRGFSDRGGDRAIEPNDYVVRLGLACLNRSKPPAAYVIDFGVLDTGETALIEMNDGFAFGAYDNLPAEVHWEVTFNRWQELIKDHEDT